MHSLTIYFVCHNSTNTYAELLLVKYAYVAEFNCLKVVCFKSQNQKHILKMICFTSI